jgi:hypothetical protein
MLRLANHNFLRAACIHALFLVSAAGQQAEFSKTVRQADVVFAGSVISIVAGDNVYSIAFRVDDPIKGVIRGEDFVLTEWSGRWNDGAPYRVGEQLLVFLRTTTASGLTSPMPEGVLRIRAGNVELPHNRRSKRLSSRTRSVKYEAFARELREAVFTSQ